MQKKYVTGLTAVISHTEMKTDMLSWQKMLEKFVNDTGVGNIVIEINDDNATPIVVYMRLRQALAEATAKEAE